MKVLIRLALIILIVLILSHNNQPKIALAQGGLNFIQISAGGNHTCGITDSGQAYCWGDNSFGQLGNGSLNNNNTPILVAGELSFIKISSGSFHTCGVTADNKAYCWGYNNAGQLGESLSSILCK